MNGWLNMGTRVAQWFGYFGNSNGLTGNTNPAVPGSTESTTRYLPDSNVNPISELAKSLDIRSVKHQIELSAEEFIERLDTGNPLPDDTLFIIDDDLYLNGINCPLTDFSGNVYVKKKLMFVNCDQLSDISGNITVEEGLSCLNCSSLTDISGTVNSGAQVLFFHCRSLANLSGNISLAGSLSFRDCTSLGSLTGNLLPGQNLYFEACPQLTELPEWITTLGSIDNRSREVQFLNTGLSDALTAQLNSQPTPGIHFDVRINDAGPEPREPVFNSFQMAFSFWQKLAASDAEIPTLTLSPDQSRELVIFLEKLTITADYEDLASRPILAKRIIHTLLSVLGNEEIQDEALDLIHDAISTCGDRVILALDDLETLELQKSAKTLAVKHDDPAKLFALGQKIMLMEQVKLIALEHAAKVQSTEEVEVVLAYQIEIRKHLELPGTTKHMLFRPCAGVSKQDIDKALVKLHRNCGEKQTQEFLKTWEPWQIYQRRLTIPPFTQLPLQTVDQIEECFIDCEISDEMVKLNNTHMSYPALCKAYVLTGNNPLTNTPLDWSEVVRLTDVVGDNSTKLQP